MIDSIYCIEIVGIITRTEFKNSCKDNNESWKIKYFKRLQEKIRLIESNPNLKLFLIFKGDKQKKIYTILKPILDTKGYHKTSNTFGKVLSTLNKS